jgi:hypothetical protein
MGDKNWNLADNTGVPTMTDNIFTGSGAIDTTIDPQMIPPIRRDAFIPLRDAQLACEEAEASEKSANEAVTELIRAHDRAYAALPRESFLDLWRASRG